MRLNFFSRNVMPEPEQPSAPHASAATMRPLTGRTFPADEIVWGIVVRNGFDELDDPGYHRGITQHAYLEGNDNVAICGFRPPQSGPRTRRRSRLALPTPGEHPMCGMCARMVVAPRPRVPVPVQTNRPPVAVPVARPAPVRAQPVPVPAPAVPAMPASTAVGATSPWVRQRSGAATQQANDGITVELGSSHDGGLLKRGIHTEPSDD
ncbi:MAG: hypothetical protein R6W93_01520 [Candidatus Limnocylindrales bacterium]